jgi:hypothetical protein
MVSGGPELCAELRRLQTRSLAPGFSSLVFASHGGHHNCRLRCIHILSADDLRPTLRRVSEPELWPLSIRGVDGLFQDQRLCQGHSQSLPPSTTISSVRSTKETEIGPGFYSITGCEKEDCRATLRARLTRLRKWSDFARDGIQHPLSTRFSGADPTTACLRELSWSRPGRAETLDIHRFVINSR